MEGGDPPAGPLPRPGLRFASPVGPAGPAWWAPRGGTAPAPAAQAAPAAPERARPFSAAVPAALRLGRPRRTARTGLAEGPPRALTPEADPLLAALAGLLRGLHRLPIEVVADGRRFVGPLLAVHPGYASLLDGELRITHVALGHIAVVARAEGLSVTGTEGESATIVGAAPEQSFHRLLQALHNHEVAISLQGAGAERGRLVDVDRHFVTLARAGQGGAQAQLVFIPVERIVAVAEAAEA